ncbi:MAG: DUF1573 domain-containing protein [Bacteroidota bacterium]
MKKVLVCFLFSFLFIGFAFGQNEASKKPVITFVKDYFDFDTIPKGKQVTCKIEFTNTGREPLIIKNVQAACGCTVANWSKKPIKKNKRGFIEITYSATLIGAFSKSLIIESNSTTPFRSIYVKGYVFDFTGY